MINLGDKVRDSITGFAGIAVAKTIWLHGCVRWHVESAKLKDGVPNNEWFDEGRLVGAAKPRRGRTGGTRTAPKRNALPRR